MYIGELARRAGIPTRTIRYYEMIGILPKAPRKPTGYRDYGENAKERLGVIHKAKDLGLTLTDIREIFEVRDRGVSPCPYVVHLLDRKLEELTGRIEGMQALRDELIEVRKRASALPAKEIAARARFCHIIENRALTAQRPKPVITLRPV